MGLNLKHAQTGVKVGSQGVVGEAHELCDRHELILASRGRTGHAVAATSPGFVHPTVEALDPGTGTGS